MTNHRDAMQAAVEALEHICRRLQMDIDDGGRPDQWSMEDLVRKAQPALSLLRAALEAREEPAALDDGVPSAKEAIAYAFKRWGYAQGTKECIAFYRGACWLQLAASPVAAPVEAREEQK